MFDPQHHNAGSWSQMKDVPVGVPGKAPHVSFGRMLRDDELLSFEPRPTR
ncbi:MAG: hypothetical protein HDS58_00565 [Barnesiella sp.]|nr:hypothetical protein [Barnesiella sp.]